MSSSRIGSVMTSLPDRPSRIAVHPLREEQSTPHDRCGPSRRSLYRTQHNVLLSKSIRVGGLRVPRGEA